MKNNILLTASLIILSAIFVGISLSVFVTRGKVSYLIAKKLKIGAMIIALTGTVSGCVGSNVTCYEPARINAVMLESNVITDGGTLKGTISNRSFFSKFRYLLAQGSDNNRVEIDKGEVIPKDGKFDQKTEDIIVNLKKGIPAGIYTLIIYSVTDEGTDASEISREIITIQK